MTTASTHMTVFIGVKVTMADLTGMQLQQQHQQQSEWSRHTRFHAYMWPTDVYRPLHSDSFRVD